MDIERENAEKPLRNLRKALKRFPSDPSAEQVHTLRTQTRRIEALVDAFTPEPKKKTQRLLKSVKPVRKAAGSVRDVDVLVGKLLTLAPEESDESLVRLVEHLGEMRVEEVRELRQTVSAHRKKARRNLKDYSEHVGKQFRGSRKVASSASAPAALTMELTEWPKLSAENIHPFRIKVKQLRYMLQLSSEVDEKLIDALGKAKDEIGDWHDWHELESIARQVLDPKTDAQALKRISEIGSGKLKRALSTANEVRDRYFGSDRRGDSKRSRVKNRR